MDRKRKAVIANLLMDEFFSDDVSSVGVLNVLDDGLLPHVVVGLLPHNAEKRMKTHVTDDELMNSYADQQFHKNFRMKKETFIKLRAVISPHYKHKLQRGDSPTVSVTQAIMISLYYLSRQLSMEDIGSCFNVSGSVVCNESKAIIEILCLVSAQYIKWPNINEIDIVCDQFSQRSRIPGVIGAIDGCHVKVEPPKEHQTAYIDRKFNHSILLQGICTATKIFTDVSIGTPGRRHDVTALKNSSFWRKLTTYGVQSLFYDEDHHLVGDSGYMCRSWCITPFEFNAAINLQKRRYNYALSKSRIVIEHCFGLLKGRWRRLLYIRKKEMVRAIDMILACCVLHNFCFLNGDHVIEELVDPERMRNPRNFNNDSEEEKRKGREKRENILQLFARD